MAIAQGSNSSSPAPKGKPSAGCPGVAWGDTKPLCHCSQLSRPARGTRWLWSRGLAIPPGLGETFLFVCVLDGAVGGSLADSEETGTGEMHARFLLESCLRAGNIPEEISLPFLFVFGFVLLYFCLLCFAWSLVLFGLGIPSPQRTGEKKKSSHPSGFFWKRYLGRMCQGQVFTDFHGE